jgi:hypothetical protein
VRQNWYRGSGGSTQAIIPFIRIEPAGIQSLYRDVTDGDAGLGQETAVALYLCIGRPTPLERQRGPTVHLVAGSR